MRLTIVILIAGSLQFFSIAAFSQSYTFNIKVKDEPVAQVLKEVELSSNFRFFYIREQIDVLRKVTMDIHEATIEILLDQLFEGQGISFSILPDDLIVLIPDEIHSDTGFSPLHKRTITGQVVDETGSPLLGATILADGTTNGTITDADGTYIILDITNESVLEFSFIGMKTHLIAVGDQSTINVSMEYAVIGIDEVISIGYGKMDKADLTGSISSVTSDELIEISSTSTSQALQGRMPGVQVTRSNGEPGSGSTIKIRGLGSLRSNNSPLVLVDGFSGNLDGINPHDIESISVLKDASAASIYGARAANGVILVTTKRGAPGKIKVEVLAEYGISSLTKRPFFLNARDYAIKMNEESEWDRAGPIWTGQYAPENLGQGTDWFDYVYQQGALVKYHVGISGGNENTKFAVSLGYLKQDGLIDNTDYNRIQTRFNFDHKFSKWLSVGANYSLGRDSKHNGNENIWGDGIKYNGYGLAIAAQRSAPSIPAYFEDGTKGIYVREKPGEITGNGTLPPHWYFGNKDFNTSRLSNRVSVFAEITIAKYFKFESILNTRQSSFYTTNWSGTWEAYIPGEDIPAQINTINGLYTSSGESFGWEIQELLTYERNFGKHFLTVLAGFSAEKYTSEWVDLTKEVFPGNALRVANAGLETVGSGGSKDIIVYESLFGRISYDYGSRYLINGTIRRDGSSAFAPGNQYGVFHSISGAWRISQEGFMSDQSLFSNLKLRVGYGQLGNAGIPSYKWISTYKLTDGHPFGAGLPQTFQAAYYPTEMTNTNMKWETTTTLDVGIDVGMFRNRLNFAFDLYNKSTTDLLWPATIPESAGLIDGPMVNIGEVLNRGWEISISLDDNIQKFRYGFSGNISRNKNSVVDMGGIADQLTDNIMIKEGYPVNSYWGYKVDGIWRTWDELESNAHRTGDIRPGDYRFVDINGVDEEGNETGEPDGVINSFDMTYLGDPIPDFYYGLSAYAAYKAIDFSFLLVGESGKQSMIEAVYGGGYSGGNVIQDYFDSRANLNDNGEVISGTTNASGANPGSGSEAVLHDLSFLRVKNVRLSYTFTRGFLPRVKVSSVKIYLNATNPLIFTDYVGWDQETTEITSGVVNRGGNQYVPVAKIFSLGISVKF